MLKGMKLGDYNNFDMWVKDSESVASLETDAYCFNVESTNDEPFRVTLVWTDPPGSLAARFYLVNNLDLIVLRNGQFYLGNDITIEDSINGEYPVCHTNLSAVY